MGRYDRRGEEVPETGLSVWELELETRRLVFSVYNCFTTWVQEEGVGRGASSCGIGKPGGDAELSKEDVAHVQNEFARGGPRGKDWSRSVALRVLSPIRGLIGITWCNRSDSSCQLFHTARQVLGIRNCGVLLQPSMSAFPLQFPGGKESFRDLES